MIEDNLNAENAATNTYRIAKGNHDYVQETKDIDTTGDKLTVEIPGDSLISLNIVGDETADYSLDVGPTENTEFEDEETYSGTDIRDAFQTVDRYLTIRCTTAASAGSEAEITFQQAR